jgi:small-conductance mechanosensitive channel
VNIPRQPLPVWTEDVDERLIHTSVLIFILIMVVCAGELASQRAVADEYWRYTFRKLIRYSASCMFLFTALGTWAQRFQGLLIVLGATGAGLAIPLAPVLVSMAGWALIIPSKLLKIGYRVQFGEIIGDVTDVGDIRTSLVKIGNWIHADQLIGRVVAVSEATVFNDPVFNYTQGAPYIWDEFTVPIAYGARLEQA